MIKTDIYDTIVKVMKNKEYKFCMLVNKVIQLNLRKERRQYFTNTSSQIESLCKRRSIL